MHEASIAQAILEQVLVEAESHGMKHVTDIVLKIGGLHHIVPDVLREFFSILAAEEAMTKEAELQIETIPIRIHCKDCGRETELSEPLFLCANCQGQNVKMISGEELLLFRMEGCTETPETVDPLV